MTKCPDLAQHCIIYYKNPPRDVPHSLLVAIQLTHISRLCTSLAPLKNDSLMLYEKQDLVCLVATQQQVIIDPG